MNGNAEVTIRARVEQLLLQISAFVVYLHQRFEEDRCTRAAASLAYTSLLAMVPLFTVIFVTISAFPAFQEWREAIENFVFRNFVPALGDQVRDYLVQFADKARGLQAAGVIVLVLTVLAMMSTVESTFNVIWRIKRKRPLMVRFLLYWSVLTLGPILIGASMVATSYIVSLSLLDLLQLVPNFTPLELLSAMNVDAADVRLQEKLVELAQWVDASLQIPLSALMNGGEPTPQMAAQDSAA